MGQVMAKGPSVVPPITVPPKAPGMPGGPVVVAPGQGLMPLELGQGAPQFGMLPADGQVVPPYGGQPGMIMLNQHHVPPMAWGMQPGAFPPPNMTNDGSQIFPGQGLAPAPSMSIDGLQAGCGWTPQPQ